MTRWAWSWAILSPLSIPAAMAQDRPAGPQPLPPPIVSPAVAAAPAALAAPREPGGPGRSASLPKADGSASVVQSDKSYPVGPPGINAFAAGAAVPAKDVVDLGARAWIDAELKGSGCQAAQGEPVLLPALKKWVASYRLKYGDIPLAETSGAALTLTSDGRVTSGRWRNIPRRVEATTPTVTSEVAVALALRDFRARTGLPGKLLGKSALEIWVDVKFDGYLAWAFTVESAAAGHHQKARYHISAARPDLPLDVRDALTDGYAGSVSGMAWTKTSSDPAAKVGLAGLAVKTAAGHAGKTDARGDFQITGMGRTTFTTALNTDGFTIAPARGSPQARSGDGDESGPIALVFDGADEYSMAQVTALHWAERTRQLLGPILSGRLLGLTTNVNREQPYSMLGNAYFDPSDVSLNFFRAASFPSGAVYRNTAAPDIIPHEFGHAVDSSYGGMLDAGLSEGLGDCLAIFMTRQSKIGKGILAPGRAYRDDATPVSFPSAIEQHDRGQAFGGFVWESIRQLQGSPTNLSEDAAHEVMKSLVFAVFVDNSNSIPSAAQLMFETDDDDNNLANGTPHSAALSAAAASRSIPVPPGLPRLALPAAAFVPTAARVGIPGTSPTGLVRPRPLQGEDQSFIYYYR